MKSWDRKLAAFIELIDRLETLKGDGSDPEDIKKIYEGEIDLKSLPRTSYPLIIVDLDESNPQQTPRSDIGYDVEILTVQIFICFRLFEQNMAIRGTSLLKGILQWEGVVKNVIVEDPPRLNGTVNAIRFTRVPYLRSIEGYLDKGFIRMVQIHTDLVIKGATT